MDKSKPWKQTKWQTVPDIYVHNLRMLLFWATVGVNKSRGGEFQDEIEEIIRSHAEAIGYKLPNGPRFMSGENSDSVDQLRRQVLAHDFMNPEKQG